MADEPGQAPPGSQRLLPIALLGVVGLAVVAVGVLLMWQSGRAAPTAGSAATIRTNGKLVVDRDEIDLGQVPVRQMVKATFQLSNAGDLPLKIVGNPTVELARGC